jgi:sporulation protein YtfJ
MEKKNPLNELLQESMAKVREMVDTNTIVGAPIATADGVTLIPISRVSIGFGGGGAAFGSKEDKPADGTLGGGIGSGVKIDPVAFLVVKDGFVRVMPVAIPAGNTVDRIVELVPDVMDRIEGMVNKKKSEEETF